MTSEERKEFKIVVLTVLVLSLLVLGSLIYKFNLYDLGYFIVCIISLFRYITVKIK